MFKWVRRFPSASRSQNMVTFITLPREIRDEIYEILLLLPILNAAPSVADVQKANTRRDSEHVSARNIRYPSQRPTKNPIVSLLLANRQLHDEASLAIERYQKCGGVALVLDLLLEGNKWFYPTWISILPYAPVVQRIRIQIRNFAASDEAGGHPFSAVWRLGHLCNNYLKRGPALVDGEDFQRTIIVEHLTVDIISDPLLDETGSSDQSAIQREMLRDFMINNIDVLLVDRYRRQSVPWGPLFLSRVRELNIAYEGNILKSINVFERAKQCKVQVVELPEKNRT
ncbi:uncharacterized protein PV09_04495 [Verruconis gallopava]|uniref:F-box domain-containing protein n=1 Tax=Verruconis gallopava TaxID=253628 RepID=A0A0D2AYD8_9PEZI|nr:uncharacterized protein PV09_04495 [Verruconis gallopava]KIW04184.1 hypothetical protein PV09_04495 [Verruconis gallopava]